MWIGGVFIKLKVDTGKHEVEEFLDKLHGVLNSDQFDIDKDIAVIINTKASRLFHYSTYYTLSDLGYDFSDIVDRLRELTVNDFSERIVDVDNLDPPSLYVFGKSINKKQVYIKLKIKNDHRKRILVVSFHYAEHEMTFPFA